MATQAQIQANRMNAQKSTGPRTAEGKAIASQNALKHGLLAQQTVIAGEDVGEFEFYRDELLGELAPAGATESVLAERVVSLSWRLRRAERAQNEAFDALLAKDADFPLPRLKKSLGMGDDSEVVAAETPLGRAVVRDFLLAGFWDVGDCAGWDWLVLDAQVAGTNAYSAFHLQDAFRSQDAQREG